MKQSRKYYPPSERVGQVPDDAENPASWNRNMTGWRKRFLDANGDPLPTDAVRIDVTTGEKLERIH